MPRAPRRDYAGALLHVVNRGHAHRPLFESEFDSDSFLGLLGAQAERGRLRVHAYCVLSTHYHLLLERTDVPLARPLGWAEDLYARQFNRLRDRDGHVFKGRYYARLVEDDLYLAHVVNYIDQNPVQAGMAQAPDAYPHASARIYAGAARQPWLAMERVQGIVSRLARATCYRPSLYGRLWEACRVPDGAGPVVVEGRAAQLPLAPLRVLVAAGPEHVQRWLIEVTRAEEGRGAPCLAVPGAVLLRLSGSLPGGEDGAGVVAARGQRDALAGLLTGLAGWSGGQVARALGLCSAAANQAAARHRERVRGEAGYARVIAEFVARALKEVYGGLAGLAEGEGGTGGA